MSTWQPIDTCPPTGLFLFYEDGAMRTLWRYDGKLSSPDIPGIQDQWGDLIVGDDAKRLTGGRPVVMSLVVQEPTHWMQLPEPPAEAE